jgi:predicted O-methyltransferase YrrM
VVEFDLSRNLSQQGHAAEERMPPGGADVRSFTTKIASILCLGLIAACSGNAAEHTQQAGTAPAAANQGAAAAPQAGGQAAEQKRSPDVIYVPTPQEVVDEMLKMANVTKNDVIYDLGSGDGRIVITAAQKYGARGIGIDIDPQRIQEANENAKKAGVTDKVKFLQQDLFASDFSDATVVTLYLLPSLNVKLRPKLWSELKPGTRVVSHSFDMGDWAPEKTADVNGRKIYYWTIPPKGAAASAANN